MTWTHPQIAAARRLRESGCTHAESAIANICHEHHIRLPRHDPHPDPAPSEAWLLPLLDRYPHDYTDPKARVRRAELDGRRRAS